MPKQSALSSMRQQIEQDEILLNSRKEALAILEQMENPTLQSPVTRLPSKKPPVTARKPYKKRVEKSTKAAIATPKPPKVVAVETKARPSWSPERRAKMADLIKKRSAAKKTASV